MTSRAGSWYPSLHLQVSEHPFRSPAELVAAVEEPVVGAELFGPCGERLGAVAVSDEDGSSGVSGLGFSGCPVAVSGRVMPVVVTSLDGCSWWRLSHVGEEVLEGLPALADDDAASAVFSPVLVLAAPATVEHSLPDGEGAGSFSAVLGAGASATGVTAFEEMG